MEPEGYDAVVVGGAFSGASTALLLRRECPGLRVLIIERAGEFDRKVGEATTEISGAFLTKRLSIHQHLNHHHVPKHGLRFWFAQNETDSFDDCGELGPKFQVRLPTFQVDRAVLDEHLLALAVEEGAELARPAKVASVEMQDGRTEVKFTSGGIERTVRARWFVDASGKAAMLSRKLNLWRPLPEHPTSSIWARFRKVKDLDSHEIKSRNPMFAQACQVSRASATNHLSGYGWWCWIIPLKGGDYSAGIVYDQRLYQVPEGENLGARLKAHLLTHPIGRGLFEHAEVVEGDVKAYSSLPYYAERIAGPGWQIVGDAAGFMDPLYSQGMDYCAWTASAAVNRIAAEHRGEKVCLDTINRDWQDSYHRWFRSLYLDKYHYLGDMELMHAAFLLDLGLFFAGPVRMVVECPRSGFAKFPFDGPLGGVVAGFMSFYNRRLSLIARKRRQAGCYGEHNLRARAFIKGFEPSSKSAALIWEGIKIWLRAELRSASLPAVESEPAPAKPAPVFS